MYTPWIASIGEGSVLGLPKKLSLRCTEVARQVRSPEGYEYSVLEFAKAVTSQEFEGSLARLPVIDQCAVCIYFSDNAYLPPNRDAPRTEMLYWAFLYGAITFFGDEMSSTCLRRRMP